MGYPPGLLATRAVVRHGSFAIIPPDGRVVNVVPGVEGCAMTILASPKLGASFVWYLGAAEPNALTSAPFAAEPGIEAFLYVMDGPGRLRCATQGAEGDLPPGGYLYAPPGAGLTFSNESGLPVRFLLYKQRHQPLPGHAPRAVMGDVNAIPERNYDGMANVFIRDLLPTDLGFDMNFHILSFAPGGCHPFVETHVQEHGAYLLEGKGVYLLDGAWREVQRDDFIFFGPFVPQACYGVGLDRLTYIYSKDCNRDVAL